MNPVITALDLSKNRAHPKNWNSFKGVKKNFSLNYERQSGKIFFVVVAHYFFNKAEETKFL